jgi:hypothetical protein
MWLDADAVVALQHRCCLVLLYERSSGYTAAAAAAAEQQQHQLVLLRVSEARQTHLQPVGLPNLSLEALKLPRLGVVQIRQHSVTVVISDHLHTVGKFCYQVSAACCNLQGCMQGLLVAYVATNWLPGQAHSVT